MGPSGSVSTRMFRRLHSAVSMWFKSADMVATILSVLPGTEDKRCYFLVKMEWKQPGQENSFRNTENSNNWYSVHRYPVVSRICLFELTLGSFKTVEVITRRSVNLLVFSWEGKLRSSYSLRRVHAIMSLFGTSCPALLKRHMNAAIILWKKWRLWVDSFENESGHMHHFLKQYIVSI